MVAFEFLIWLQQAACQATERKVMLYREDDINLLKGWAPGGADDSGAQKRREFHWVRDYVYMKVAETASAERCDRRPLQQDKPAKRKCGK